MGELNMRHSHATHDLYNRIRDGNPPEWTWYVQTMPVSADPAEVGFDPLDDTKVTSGPLYSPAIFTSPTHAGCACWNHMHSVMQADMVQCGKFEFDQSLLSGHWDPGADNSAER